MRRPDFSLSFFVDDGLDPLRLCFFHRFGLGQVKKSEKIRNFASPYAAWAEAGLVVTLDSLVQRSFGLEGVRVQLRGCDFGLVRRGW